MFCLVASGPSARLGPGAEGGGAELGVRTRLPGASECRRQPLLQSPRPSLALGYDAGAAAPTSRPPPIPGQTVGLSTGSLDQPTAQRFGATWGSAGPPGNVSSASCPSLPVPDARPPAGPLLATQEPGLAPPGAESQTPSTWVGI